MKTITATAFGAALALAMTGGAAQAQQDTANPASPPAQSPAGNSKADAGATASASFTDTEVRQFAGAALSVNKIQQEGGVPAAEKQTKILAAVQKSGLSPQRFNEIAQASRSDPALMQRVQAAAAEPASPAASTPGASGTSVTPGAPTPMPGSSGMPATPATPATPADPGTLSR